jgi:ubiquinone biosynthesis monooxygenase Coq7
MRVNHSGEIAAQALYQGQALFAQTDQERAFLLQAGQEEADHLRWTRDRVGSLGSRTSLLDPLWYVGAFALGAVASRLGSPVSMGFLSETEIQVEAHLKGHLQALPEQDHESRAVVQQMMADERSHAQAAQRQGGKALPVPVPQLMKASAKLMTTTAYWV